MIVKGAFEVYWNKIKKFLDEIFKNEESIQLIKIKDLCLDIHKMKLTKKNASH